MLDLNITILFQLVNFLIAVYVLNILLVRPIRAILQERKNTMDNLQGEADAFTREARERMSTYQAALSKARHEATLARDAARAEGLTEQQSIVADAGLKAQAHISKAQDAIKQEADEALASLQKQVKILAGKVATQVLN
ncbi:MAG: ATP synthase F0 subunit B [Desulfovibrionaceae bacterium]